MKHSSLFELTSAFKPLRTPWPIALALAGLLALVLSPVCAKASPLIYADGDLFIGFHSVNAANDYLVDIGQYTQFDGAPVGTHIAVGNWAQDLTTVFGGGWATDSFVQWGSAGTLGFGNGSQTNLPWLFATHEAPMSRFALPWSSESTAAATGTESHIESMAYGNFYGNMSTANNPTGFIQAAGLSNSWASWNGGADSPSTSFQTWLPSVEAPTPSEVGVGGGITTTRLDLFKMTPDNTGTNPPGTYLGSLSINSGGDVSFDVFAPIVPTGVVSRKRQGQAGKFNINLPLSGTPGIECRRGGESNSFTVVVSFSAPVTLQNASIISGSATISSATVGNNNIEVFLINVANVQTIRVQLSGVSDGTHFGDVIVPMSVLLGDVTGDSQVTADDVALVRSQVGQPVTTANFREDVTHDGQIAYGDGVTVQSVLGTHLP